MRDLTDPDGGFYSAEDADSVPPEAGRRSVGAQVRRRVLHLDRREIGALPGDDAASCGGGSASSRTATRRRIRRASSRGQNILYIAQSIEDVAARTGLTPDAVVDALGRARAKLFAARARPRPHLDDKVLTAWNGLMIAAFARAARVLAGAAAAPRCLAAARRAAEFIRRRCGATTEQRLLRRYRDGEAAIEGYAEDYASLVWGCSSCFRPTATRRGARRHPLPRVVARAFGGRPIVGQTVEVGGRRREVIGIMPPGADVMDNRTEIWLPLGLNPANRQNRGNHFLYLIGRLKDGVTTRRRATN